MKKNKFPCKDANGNPVAPKGPLTGWIFTDTSRQCDCPKCGSVAGYLCQTPSGKKTDYPHGERSQVFSAQVFPGNQEKYCIKGGSGLPQVLKDLTSGT